MTSMSAADLVAVLISKYLHYDFDAPENPSNDHLPFSKGHASPLFYSIYRAAGAISERELFIYRRFGSLLERPSHPCPDLGRGGHRLPGARACRRGMGVAVAGKRLDRLPYQVWVLCGDSEITEGSMWEAFEHAGHARLDNLTAIIDVNRLGQRGETMHAWDLNRFVEPARAFGWHAIAIDGHDLDAIDRAYTEAVETTGPTHGSSSRERSRERASAPSRTKTESTASRSEDTASAVAELGGVRDIRVEVRKPTGDGKPHAFEVGPLELPRYEPGEEVATRKAYGEALAALGGDRGDIVGLDAEIGNSTHAEIFAKAHPERYFEMYIAEQQMVAAAVGLQVRGWVPFASTFATFLTRAYDFIRMAAVSRADICLVGSHTPGSRSARTALPDGSRGPRHAPRRARQHGPLSM